MSKQVVIVGAGHAAGQVVATLKQKKFDGRIVLVGDEAYLPYQRPPLSKKYLEGKMPAERLLVKPPGFYDAPDIDVRLDTRVASIDRAQQRISTSSGDVILYDELVLATGSDAIRPPIAGNDLGGVHYLRTISDVDAIREELATARRVAIIGAGYIGLEVAAVLRTLGLDVTVVEMADRVMSRVVSADVSAFYQQVHIGHGVALLLSAACRRFIGTDRVAAVETDDGQRIDVDFVVVGAGITPTTSLADEAGLEVDNGIVVDEYCVTSDPHIYAIGDCTSHPNEIYQRRVRLESVHNALEQAKTAALSICGEPAAYQQVPWFWSDQYDLKLQIAGLSAGFDEAVIRGDREAHTFSCAYLQDGRLIAIDAINAPRDFMQAKPLIAARTRVDRSRLADASVMLKDLA